MAEARRGLGVCGKTRTPAVWPACSFRKTCLLADKTRKGGEQATLGTYCGGWYYILGLDQEPCQHG
ncbi:hypothetical protein BaRGS_00011362, partial [Batillaria attramentaria]